jgi:hypothetical protein
MERVSALVVLDRECREATESLRPFDQSVKANLQGTATICDDKRATGVAALIPSGKNGLEMINKRRAHTSENRDDPGRDKRRRGRRAEAGE